MRKIVKKYIFLFINLALFAFFWHRFTFDCKGQLYSYQGTIKTYDNKLILNYQLPYKETLFLSIKMPKSTTINTAACNNNILQPAQLYSDTTNTYIFDIPKEYIFSGKNTLLITFLKSANFNIIIKIFNYRKKISENIFILFSDNHIFQMQKHSYYIFSTFIVFLIFFALLFYFRKASSLLEKIYGYAFWFFLSLNIILGASFLVL